MRLAEFAEPLVKLLPPEVAHRIAVAGMKVAPPKPAPPRGAGLVVSALGLEFPNPLGLAAGFDKNGEVPGPMLNLGFGFVEIGTLTPRPQAGNARPRLFRLREDGAVINRFGFNNQGYEKSQDSPRPATGRSDRRQRRRQQGFGRPGRGLRPRGQNLRPPRRLRRHKRLFAEHARFARLAAPRDARRPFRPGRGGPRRDRARPAGRREDRPGPRRSRTR